MGTQIARNVFLAIGVIVLAFVIYAVMTMPDQRSATDKVSDAIHDLPQGPGVAARQLEDRTPGQKIGDAIKDNTESR